MIEHRSAANFIRFAGSEYGLTSRDRMLLFASVNFDASVEEIFAPLTSGATLALRTDAMLSSASAFLDQCAAWQITVIGLPTAYWHELAAAIGMSDSLVVSPSVRTVIVGGESVRADRLQTWRQRVGDRIRLINTYGPTEATVVATTCDLAGPAGSRTVGSGETPIGRPIWNTQILLLDEQRQQVPIGVRGEIYIGGEGLARGYLHRPELTRERFIPHPFDATPGARLYRTGDYASYLPDGTHPDCRPHRPTGQGSRFSGRDRRDRIGAGDGIQDCGRQWSSRGRRSRARRGSPRTCRERTSSTDRTRVARLPQGTLPEYMIPAGFPFVESLPRLTNGKVDRSALCPMRARRRAPIRGLGSAAHLDRARARGDLGAGPRRRSRRHPRQLLRSRGPLAASRSSSSPGSRRRFGTTLPWRCCSSHPLSGSWPPSSGRRPLPDSGRR